MALTDFPKRLLETLNEKGITQTEFAKMMDVSKTTVSYWISGKRDPETDTFFKILEVLDVDYIDLNFNPGNGARQEMNFIFRRANLKFDDFEPKDLVKIRDKLVEYLLVISKPYNKKLNQEE